MEMAAGGAAPPGGRPPGTTAGGGYWEWAGEGQPPGGPPGGPGMGGGGIVDVNVVNWPAWMESEDMAAGPQRGGTTFLTDEDMARIAATIKTPGERKEQKTAEEKAAEKAAREEERQAAKEAKAQFGRPTQTAASRAARSGRLGILTTEEQEDVLNPPRTGAEAPSERSEMFQRAQIEIQEQLAASRQGLPVRGAGVTVAQLLAGPSRGGITERLARGGRKLGEAVEIEGEIEAQEKAYRVEEASLAKLNKMKDEGVDLTKEQSKELTAIPERMKDITDSTGALRVEQKGLLEEARDLTKLTLGEKMTNLGKSFVGNIAGILSFSTALGGATAAVGLAGAAVGDYLERSSGYLLATQHITNALSDQTKASGGAAQQTVAQTAATANMTMRQYENIAANLEGRATIESANKAYDEQLKLQAASRNVGAGQRGGFDQGLFQTTGGILNTPLFGTPSTGELLSRDIQAAYRASGIAGVARGPNAVSQERVNPETGIRPPTEEMTAAVEKYTEELGLINENFVGTGLKLVEANNENRIATEEAAAVLDEAGFGDLADRIEDREVRHPRG